MNSPYPGNARDVTEAVLDAMLNEALNLTDEIAAAGAMRRAVGAPDSFECALRLRMAARLSRIAAWASLRISDDPERMAIAQSALNSAAAPAQSEEVGLAVEIGDSELAPFVGMVERIVDRALRLDALLSGQATQSPEAAEALHSEQGSASVLPFRRRAPQGDVATEEQAFESP